MTDVLTEIKINRPLLIVSEYAANPDNAPLWYENIKSAEWKTAKPLQTGSQVAFTAHFLGKKLEYVYEIKKYIPGKILIMETAHGPFPMQTIYTWTAIDEHTTLMTLRNTGSPSGFAKLFSPFTSFMMRKANEKDLRKIKSILENPG